MLNLIPGLSRYRNDVYYSQSVVYQKYSKSEAGLIVTVPSFRSSPQPMLASIGLAENKNSLSMSPYLTLNIIVSWYPIETVGAGSWLYAQLPT